MSLHVVARHLFEFQETWQHAHAQAVDAMNALISPGSRSRSNLLVTGWFLKRKMARNPLRDTPEDEAASSRCRCQCSGYKPRLAPLSHRSWPTTAHHRGESARCLPGSTAGKAGYRLAQMQMATGGITPADFLPTKPTNGLQDVYTRTEEETLGYCVWF